MNAGEIGTEAGRIFGYNLPSSWIFRSQEDQNDHGIDGEIELKDDKGRALGKESIFKVQIKGEEKSSFIKSDSVLSFALKIERLKYYLEFKIPLILFVVETSSDRVFWVSITDNEILRKTAAESQNTDTLQIHIPIENALVRKEPESADKILSAVMNCWDYLSVKGLRESVVRYPSVTPSQLNKKIEDIGGALFKAYHQKLNNLLYEKKFDELYPQAVEISLSPIVPAKDRFIATLYYWQAFQIAPYTNIARRVFEENCNICYSLVRLAREIKSDVPRLMALGKSRRVKFKMQLDQLYAVHHSIENFSKDSFEHFISNQQTQNLYRESCVSLQKLIELCNRLTMRSQYSVLSDLFVDIYPLILIFRVVHKARGSEESIEFLERWHEGMSLLMIAYCIIDNDPNKIERLYRLVSIQLKENSSATIEARKLILSSFPDLEPSLDNLDRVATRPDNTDFYSITIEEQKDFFAKAAKNLRMDPDDPDCKYGRIVAMGLKNYDPTNIMKNCESLFVHYRSGGLIAQSLQMHSVGGMHLLVCLKFGHAQGTGNLLSRLYDNTDGPNLGLSFKQQYCNKCSECRPRPYSWTWSLRWYMEALPEHKDFLDKYKNW